MRTLYVSWRLRAKGTKSALRAKSRGAFRLGYGCIPVLLLGACSRGSAGSEPRLGVTHRAAAPQDETTSAQAFEPTLESRRGPLASHAGDQLGKATTDNENAAGSEQDKGPQPTNVAHATDHLLEASVTQLLTTPVSHLTAGKRRGAALTKAVAGTTKLAVFALDGSSNAGHPAVPFARAAPDELANSTQTLGLFMGRDDWPRVITTSDGNGQHYFRFRPTPGWESPREEQGALVRAGLAFGFYGVLGHDDPEVLCAPQTFCYEKRQTGWQKRPNPGAGVWTVRRLSNGEAWAWTNLTPASLCRLDDTWDCTVPHPGAALLSMAYVNGTSLALTSTGLMSYTGTWTLLTKLTNGRALAAFGTKTLILTDDGVWMWDGQLHRVHNQGKPLNGGCCLESPVTGSNAFIIGGEQGVARLTFE